MINPKFLSKPWEFNEKMHLFKQLNLIFSSPSEYAIIDCKQTRIPLETIVKLLPYHKAHSSTYKVVHTQLKMHPRETTVISITSNPILVPIPGAEMGYASFSAYEDKLIDEAIKKENLELIQRIESINAKKELIDEDLVQEMQLHPIVEKYFNLAAIYEKFKGIDGFLIKIKDIIETYHKSNCIKHEMLSRRGILFELGYANLLSTPVKKFNTVLIHKSTKAEYDIETESTLIQCKLTNKTFEDHKSEIVPMSKIAHEHGKQFILIVGEKLSEKNKLWFRKNNIPCKDNQLSFVLNKNEVDITI